MYCSKDSKASIDSAFLGPMSIWEKSKCWKDWKLFKLNLFLLWMHSCKSLRELCWFSSYFNKYSLSYISSPFFVSGSIAYFSISISLTFSQVLSELICSRLFSSIGSLKLKVVSFKLFSILYFFLFTFLNKSEWFEVLPLF